MIRKWMGFDTELANAFYRPGRPIEGGAAKAAWLLLEGLRPDGWRRDPPAPGLLDLARGSLDLDAFPPGIERWSWLCCGKGRTWLARGVPGGCAYFDHCHLEVASACCDSVEELLLAWTAWREHLVLLRARVQALLPDDTRLMLSASVSDGQMSWGSHLNTLVTDELFEALMTPGPTRDGYLAFLAASICIAGAGQLAPEGPIVSQRAPFIECIASGNTTQDDLRPLLNTRDEPHCVEGRRLHTICYDSLLLPFAFRLSRGIHALVLALLEHDPLALAHLALVDPVRALHEWNDGDLQAAQPLVRGPRLTMIEFLRCVQQALARLDPPAVEEVVPGARGLIEMFDQTLMAFERGDADWLARRIQWVHRHSILEQYRAGDAWHDPRLRLLDHAYDLLDPEVGLALAAERAGAFAGGPDPAAVARRREIPPPGRAAQRVELLIAGQVAHVDWDHVIQAGRRHSLARLDGAPDSTSRPDWPLIFPGST